MSERRERAERREVNVPAMVLSLARMRAERRLIEGHREELVSLVNEEYIRVDTDLVGSPA